MIFKIIYRFGFLAPVPLASPFPPSFSSLIDKLIDKEHLQFFVSQALKPNFNEDTIDHRKVVLSFMQILGSEWIPKTLVKQMTIYVNKYGLSPMLNLNLFAERILARGSDVIDILPELFLLLNENNNNKTNLLSFQNTVLSVLPKDLSELRTEVLIALFIQTLRLKFYSEQLLGSLAKGLIDKLKKFDKDDVLDFLPVYQNLKQLNVSNEIKKLLSQFEAKLTELLPLFNHREFVEIIRHLNCKKQLDEELLKALEKKALFESRSFPSHDIFDIISFFRTFVSPEESKLILQLLQEFAKQKLCRMVRKPQFLVYKALDEDPILQDILTLSIYSFEWLYLNTYSLLPRQITSDVKSKLGNHLIEQRLIYDLLETQPSKCLLYLLVCLEAKIINVDILKILEDKVLTESEFTHQHLEAFCMMAKDNYLPKLNGWAPFIEKLILSTYTSLNGESFFHAIYATAILILEGETNFEEILRLLTNFMLEKKIRFPWKMKFEIFHIFFLLPDFFDWNIAQFFLEGLAEFPPRDLHSMELNDNLAKIVQKLESLFSAKNRPTNRILIRGKKLNNWARLRIDLPAKIVPIWKKSEEIFRTNAIKRKPMFQVSSLEDQVEAALSNFIKNKKTVILGGGHFVNGFEVDILVKSGNNYIIVEVNGKAHYYRNHPNRLNWATNGKENFFKKCNIMYLSVGMVQWNKSESKNEIFENFFQKFKLKSAFLNSYNQDENDQNENEQIP